MTSLCDAALVYGALCSDHPSLFPYQERFLRDIEIFHFVYSRPVKSEQLRGRQGVVVIDEYEKPAGPQLPRLLVSLMARLS